MTATAQQINWPPEYWSDEQKYEHWILQMDQGKPVPADFEKPFGIPGELKAQN